MQQKTQTAWIVLQVLRTPFPTRMLFCCETDRCQVISWQCEAQNYILHPPITYRDVRLPRPWKAPLVILVMLAPARSLNAASHKHYHRNTSHYKSWTNSIRRLISPAKALTGIAEMSLPLKLLPWNIDTLKMNKIRGTRKRTVLLSRQDQRKHCLEWCESGWDLSHCINCIRIIAEKRMIAKIVTNMRASFPSESSVVLAKDEISLLYRFLWC